MQCPKDKNAMRTLAVKSFNFDACDTCGGVWFDEEELKKTAQTFAWGIPGQPEELAPLLKKNDVPPAVVEQKREWPFEEGVVCPLDGMKTERFAYAGDSGIILDKCGTCGGTWFDGDELVHLAEYLKPKSRDKVGKLLAQGMVQSEKELREMAALPARLAAAFSSPMAFAGFAIYLVVKYLGARAGLDAHTRQKIERGIMG